MKAQCQSTKFWRWSVRASVAMVLAVGAVCATANAIRVFGGRMPAPNGGVNLPYMTNDNKGQTWRIYQGGYQQNQGPTPNGGNTATYSQGAVIMVNGNGPNAQTNQGHIDEKTGELVLEGMTAGGYTITRRILTNKEDGYVRYIDIIKNTGGADQNVQVVITTSLNYGINAAQNVMDPKKKDQAIGWAAQTGSMACLWEMYAGKNSKVAAQVVNQQGNSQCQANYTLNIPANKEVAILHLHGIANSQEAGAQFMTTLKEANLMKTIPRDLRKLIVNFAGGQSFIGDLEILRGDLLDVVELKSGDQLKGTLKEQSYDLATFYGNVSLPVEKVIAVMNAGQFRPRQLVVTTDGQVFGGRLKKDTVDLQLSSGQVTQVPLSQVNRIGYRKRPGEPEEWTFEKPIVLMRSGERVGVKMPTAPIEVATRYGKLSLKPEQVGAVVLQGEDNNGVHQVLLTDGSRFAGLLSASEFDMTLDTPAGEEVKFPVSSISRFQLTPKIAEPDDDTPTLKMANDDLLVGIVTGQLKIDTAFDTITVNASEIKSLARVKESATDVQVVLWDGTTLSGQLQEMDLPVQLAGGLVMKAPVALLEEYTQPQPAPNKETVERIKKLIENLNSEDWKTRDRAQADLTGMGPVAIKVLKQLRTDQPPEAQARFDTILKDLEKQKDKAKPGAPTGGTGAANPSPLIRE